MEFWQATQSTVLIDQPGKIFINLVGRSFDENPKKERFHATVITSPPEDPESEEQRLVKGLTRLITILQEKLNALEGGGAG